MALEQRLTPKLQQRLVMTPALQLAIKLLQLGRMDLEQTLQQEMVENPLLEEREPEGADEAPSEETAVDDDGPAEESEEDATSESLIDNLDIEAYFTSYYDYEPPSSDTTEIGEAPPLENTLATSETLPEHLLWQLEMSDCSPLDARIGAVVIGNIDEDGYLVASAEEIAESGGWQAATVEAVIERIQQLDPPGIAAKDLGECLLIQLERLGLSDHVAARIVQEHFDDLGHHRYRDIARACGVDLEAVAESVEVIRRLNPKPGQQYSEETTRYIIPDVHVIKDGDDWIVTLNDDGLPRLRISRHYRRLLRTREGVSNEASQFLQERLRSALWLIKSFGQRQRTIRKVAESIVQHQLEFLDRGVVALRPMVLRDVAEDIEMHESTVSRVVNGKYMHTPQGIFEMKFFFHSGLGHASGSDVSSIAVKESIRHLIEDEDSHGPLSDAAIARELEARGLQIARRTVAKYREELGIPASKARRAIR